MIIVMFDLILFCRGEETSCYFLLMSHRILSCASCCSSFRATTAFTSSMVDLTRGFCFRCAPYLCLWQKHLLCFTLFYISGFSKEVFIKRKLQGISIFFSSSFWKSPTFGTLHHIISKILPSLVSIGGPMSS